MIGQKHKVTIWTYGRHPKLGQSYKTELVTCGIWCCLQKIESEFSYTVGHPAGERNTHMFGDQKLSEAKQHWEYRSILRVEFQGGTVEIFPLGGIFAKSTAHDPHPYCKDQQPRLIIHLIETGGTGNVQSDHKWVAYYFRISSLWKKKILKQNQVSTLSKQSEEKLVVKSYFKSPGPHSQFSFQMDLYPFLATKTPLYSWNFSPHVFSVDSDLTYYFEGEKLRPKNSTDLDQGFQMF